MEPTMIAVDPTPEYVYPMQVVTMVGNTVAICTVHDEQRIIDVSMIPGAKLVFTGEELLFQYRGITMPIGCILPT